MVDSRAGASSLALAKPSQATARAESKQRNSQLSESVRPHGASYVHPAELFEEHEGAGVCYRLRLEPLTMKNLMHTLSVDSFVPMLQTLSLLLDKGAEHAAAKKVEFSTLAQARLALDMFPLTRQVQIACDQAKNGTARLIGQEPPRMEDTEQTLDELKARLGKTVEYLRGLSPELFVGAEERAIQQVMRGTLVLEMKGLPYLMNWCLPQFYFHVTTAYDILRHHGVEIGKSNYLTHMGGHIRPLEGGAK